MLISEWVRSQDWSVIFSLKYSRPSNINVGEYRSKNYVMRWLAYVVPSSRTVGWFDSRVLLGGVSKGRNSAPQLNRMQLAGMPTEIGGCVYLGAGHVRSGDNFGIPRLD